MRLVARLRPDPRGELTVLPDHLAVDLGDGVDMRKEMEGEKRKEGERRVFAPAIRESFVSH